LRRHLPLALALGAFVLLVVGGGVWWFLATHERVQVDVDTGYRGLARYNPYRAAELFLDEMGVPTESRFALGELPAQDRALVILVDDLQARRGLVPQLREWVAAGGHLIVAAAPPEELVTQDDDEEPDEPASHEGDPLLTMAGLALARTEGDPPGASIDAEQPDAGTGSKPPDAGPPGAGPPDAGPPGAGPPDAGPPGAGPPDAGNAGGGHGGIEDLLRSLGVRIAERRVVPVSLPEGSEPMQAEMDVRWTLVDTVTEAQFETYEPGGAPRQFVPVLEVPLEQGWVTVVVDDYFMTNPAIGSHDHARLLHELVVIGATPPAGAVLIVRARSSGLAGLLWQRAWAAVISMTVLILAWVWMASRRFGPVLPTPSRSRRSMAEHVDAVGAFLWRHGYHELLLESTRAALRHKLAARLGGDTELEGEALAHAVSEETGVRESRVHQAFYGGGPKDRKAFTEAMRELQRLWRSK
jgi:hypothetical protein